MKSTLSNKSCEKELPYPKLMKSDSSTAIVLMTHEEAGGNGVGVVVHGKNKDRRGIGFHHNKWKLSSFIDYNGSVCLENGDES